MNNQRWPWFALVWLGFASCEALVPAEDGQAPSAQALCPAPQVYFEGRCAIQCPAQDNTLCELDGRRIQFAPKQPSPADVVDAGQACPLGCGSTRIKTLALGLGHTCALMDDGSVRCVGDDSYGQRGESSRLGPVPQLVASHIYAGSHHTCAILPDETAVCWGRNDFGQLGDGTQVNRSLPTKVKDVAQVKELAPSDVMTYARLADGRVVVWGDTSGFARQAHVTLTPKPTGIDNAVQLAATGSGVCARRGDGTIRCFGWLDGMSGNSSPEASMTLEGNVIDDAQDLACIELHVCLVLRRDGSVVSWGFQRYGVNGHGVVSEDKLPPMLVRSLSGMGVMQLATGSNFACARRSDGATLCWGRNHVEQLGFASKVAAGEYVPTQVPGLTGIQRLMAGPTALHMCAETSDQKVLCWGNDLSGQRGGSSLSVPLSFE